MSMNEATTLSGLSWAAIFIVCMLLLIPVKDTECGSDLETDLTTIKR